MAKNMDIMSKIGKTPAESFFIFTGLVFGLITLLITPPFQAPDEYNHYARSYQVSDGIPVPYKIVVNAGDVAPYEHINSEYFRQNYNFAVGGYLPASIAYTFENSQTGGLEFNPDVKQPIAKTLSLIYLPLNEKDRIFFHFCNNVFSSPILYLPQATGMIIGKSIGCSPLLLLYMGRIANLLVWLLLVYTALKILPLRKLSFLFLSLMPMSLFQASSLSADSFTNGVVFLFIAYILCAIAKTGNISSKTYTYACVLIMLVSLTKIAYLPIVGLVLLLPNHTLQSKKKAYILSVVVMCAGAVTVLFWMNIANDLYIPYVPFSSPEGQLAFMRENPASYLRLLFGIVMPPAGSDLLRQYIGQLGWLDTVFPPWFYLLHVVAMFGIAFLDNNHAFYLTRKDQVVVFLCVTSSVVLIVTGIYVYWMPVGAEYVEVQGRYFIPLGPLLLLLIPKVRLAKVPSQNAVVYLLILFSLGYMTYKLVDRYYL